MSPYYILVSNIRSPWLLIWYWLDCSSPNYHSGVWHTFSVTFAVFIGEIIGNGCDISLQVLEVTINHILVIVVGVIALNKSILSFHSSWSAMMEYIRPFPSRIQEALLYPQLASMCPYFFLSGLPPCNFLMKLMENFHGTLLPFHCRHHHHFFI